LVWEINITHKVGIIIPIYNESKILIQLINNFITYTKDKQNFYLFLVDDNSTDKSQEIISTFRTNHFISVIKTPKNLGYGGAVNYGLTHLTTLNFDWGVVMDSDMTNPFEDLSQIYLSIVSNNCDYIKGSRKKKGGGTVGTTRYRRFLSEVGNLVARIFCYFLISDPTNGFRAIKLNFFKKLRVKDNSFSAITEELFQVIENRGILKEFPTILRGDRALRAESSFDFRLAMFLRYLYWILKLFKIGPIKIRKQVL
jgi:glycosyltransferase involved in cell wall biosynthesis